MAETTPITDLTLLEPCGAVRSRPEMMDYNGHLNVGWYGILFEDAARAFFGRMDLSRDYCARTARALFVTEQHQTFLAEIREGEGLEVFVKIAGVTAKAVHVLYLMAKSASGEIAAAQETLYLHVDHASRRVVAIDDTRLARLSSIAARHQNIGLPVAAGRAIVLRGVSP
ncbi:MAG: thioesterase family protein [Hyphomicrobiaceae bacterium]